MDDSCAVCAETLGWVAYGPCGHREVCSTCIIRLRFICDDRSCCICKCESNIIFVTKALGDYTNLINDFSAFPNNPTEGQVGPHWFHVGAQAYFDDFDHYKMMKAMCKLSCSACDGKNEQRNGGSKSTRDFNNVEQLKFHLFEKHRLFMCSLCLEGRKIFISEQKLYNRAQLNQHVKTGDSVVDGSENERGGFIGHPMCEFCQNPFYGDNELYLHMSTEHFTCHICQRRHPGKYEYYKDYDDMEIHFRREHFLCEDPACLAKKFIVFASGSEMKRHDTMEHGGRMSRSKHSAIMQIPTSFQYQQNAEQDQWCRGRGKHSDSSSIQRSRGIQENLETSNALRCHDVSLNGTPTSGHRERRVMESTGNPFELLGSTDSEMSLRCSQALGQNSARTLLEQTSFPPLHITSSNSEQRSRKAVLSCGNTMAAHLRHQISVRVVNTSRASPAGSSHLNSSAGIIHQARPIFESRPLSSSSSLYVSHHKLATNDNAPSSHPNSFLSKPSTSDARVSSNAVSSSRTGTGRSKVSHCSSAPNLVKREILDKTTSDPHVNKATTGVHPPLKVEDAHAANKALVEKIRAALDYDNDKFAAFKVISVEYRQDLIDTAEYLAYVHQFGLENLVLDLALLCPNAHKQTELVEIHNYNMRTKGSSENCSSSSDGQPKCKKSSRKGKEKFEDNGFFSSDLAVKLNIGRTNLQVNDKPPPVEVELPSKGKSHSAKIESEIVIDEQSKLKAMEPKDENDAQPSNGSSMKTLGSGWEKNKPRKKMSKFLKHRLGETSATEISENSNIDVGIDGKGEKTYLRKHPPEILQVHGVWQNGGGRRLVVMAQKIAKR